MKYLTQENMSVILVSLFFTISFLGAFLPMIPACVVAWSGILIHKLWMGDASVSWTLFIIITCLAILAQVIDWLCTYWGVKKFGGTWRGGVGAILGLIAGPLLLTPIFGLIIGPVLGATIGELTNGTSLKQAGKAGFGTIVGGFVAFLMKLAILLFIISSFYTSIIA